MADPTKGKDLKPGVKWTPNALADVPSDWKAMYDAGTPYTAIVAPQTADATIPKFAFALGSSGAAPSFAWVYLTAIDGSGATVIMTDEAGNPMLVYAPTS